MYGVSPSMFGAVGTLSSDDTISVQTAINAAASSGRLCVLSNHGISANIVVPANAEILCTGTIAALSGTPSFTFAAQNFKMRSPKLVGVSLQIEPTAVNGDIY